MQLACGERAAVAASADGDDRLVVGQLAGALGDMCERDVGGAADVSVLPLDVLSDVQRRGFAAREELDGSLGVDALAGREESHQLLLARSTTGSGTRFWGASRNGSGSSCRVGASGSQFELPGADQRASTPTPPPPSTADDQRSPPSRSPGPRPQASSRRPARTSSSSSRPSW